MYQTIASNPNLFLRARQTVRQTGSREICPKCSVKQYPTSRNVQEETDWIFMLYFNIKKTADKKIFHVNCIHCMEKITFFFEQKEENFHGLMDSILM